jgi:hypothetical protein
MAKRRTIVSPEEDTDLKRLQAAYVAAAKAAIAILRANGVASQSFREADLEARAIAQRIKKILGTGRLLDDGNCGANAQN